MFIPNSRLTIHTCITGLLPTFRTATHGDTREVQVYFDHSPKVSDL